MVSDGRLLHTRAGCKISSSTPNLRWTHDCHDGAAGTECLDEEAGVAFGDSHRDLVVLAVEDDDEADPEIQLEVEGLLEYQGNVFEDFKVRFQLLPVHFTVFQ